MYSVDFCGNCALQVIMMLMLSAHSFRTLVCSGPVVSMKLRLQEVLAADANRVIAMLTVQSAVH